MFLRKKMNEQDRRLQTLSILILMAWIAVIGFCVSRRETKVDYVATHDNVKMSGVTSGVNSILLEQLTNSDVVVVEAKTITVGESEEDKKTEEEIAKEKKAKKKKAYRKKLKKIFGYVPSEYEIEVVKRITMHESGNTEPHDGIVAVMACIANRCRSRDSGFADTVTGVASQKNQMTCYTDGSIWLKKYDVNEKVEKAWKDFIDEGYKRHPIITFWSAGDYNPYCKPAYPIGGHYFGY